MLVDLDQPYTVCTIDLLSPLLLCPGCHVATFCLGIWATKRPAAALSTNLCAEMLTFREQCRAVPE